jgi:hypothetical protein
VGNPTQQSCPQGWFTATFDAQLNFATLVRSGAQYGGTGYTNLRIGKLINALGTELSSPMQDALIE